MAALTQTQTQPLADGSLTVGPTSKLNSFYHACTLAAFGTASFFAGVVGGRIIEKYHTRKVQKAEKVLDKEEQKEAKRKELKRNLSFLGAACAVSFTAGFWASHQLNKLLATYGTTKKVLNQSNNRFDNEHHHDHYNHRDRHHEKGFSDTLRR
eukprot:CAMPEP_0194571868 /NCGR_PEP_ID=MMETSP0292-20121207/8679_1 /TAXON_ID=39354 /ORGANISM="Heterosigma akashiwo, Strain CCMP2393" /LENGTH=152 /DNA_ID=CAMNT_0039422739 /DNA_START=14 /DNA_END=472 /DNA_ORIENTATION=-